MTTDKSATPPLAGEWTARDALEDVAKGLDKRVASLQAMPLDTHPESAVRLSVKADTYRHCTQLLRTHPAYTLGEDGLDAPDEDEPTPAEWALLDEVAALKSEVESHLTLAEASALTNNPDHHHGQMTVGDVADWLREHREADHD